VRQPGPIFAAVDAEALQPSLDVPGEPSRAAPLIFEDEHADASRLAIPRGRETNFGRPAGSIAQRTGDRLDLSRRPVPEEGEGDMQVFARHHTHARQLLALPVADLVEDVVGQAQREEEPEPFIATHATR
jgi:hypothetical protein